MSTPPATHDLRRFDVCNGDADGLIAVLQWRLHDPAPATLVTGLKRDTALLERVPPGADEVLVCDLSIGRNRAALLRLLDAGAHVRYVDHHAAEDVPRHPRLETLIDADPGVCTSLLMDRWLAGRYHRWALVGAFGDALTGVAQRRAAAMGLDDSERAALRRLGEALNYNAYGDTESDVFIPPDRLYRVLARHEDPFDLLAREAALVDELDARRRADLRQARAVPAPVDTPQAHLVVLPDAPWSRRVAGSFANELALERPLQAQAVLRRLGSGGFLVSVRAPRASPHGAGRLCAAFGGGGRASAGGIDHLPERELATFADAFAAARWTREAPG